jgi:uncharacterized NAD(P)/FAD-binding protein YdhS
MRTQRIFVIDSLRARPHEGGSPVRRDPLEALLPAGNARHLPNPTDVGTLGRIRANDRVLVLGTGPAAIDAVLMLDAQGHRAPIRLVSRHGLSPQTQKRVVPAAAWRLAELLAAGRLEVCAGLVRGAAAYGDTFVVDILPRGRTLHSSERYDWIVNAVRTVRDAGSRAEHGTSRRPDRS